MANFQKVERCLDCGDDDIVKFGFCQACLGPDIGDQPARRLGVDNYDNLLSQSDPGIVDWLGSRPSVVIDEFRFFRKLVNGPVSLRAMRIATLVQKCPDYVTSHPEDQQLQEWVETFPGFYQEQLYRYQPDMLIFDQTHLITIKSVLQTKPEWLLEIHENPGSDMPKLRHWIDINLDLIRRYVEEKPAPKIKVVKVRAPKVRTPKAPKAPRAPRKGKIPEPEDPDPTVKVSGEYQGWKMATLMRTNPTYLLWYYNVIRDDPNTIDWIHGRLAEIKARIIVDPDLKISFGNKHRGERLKDLLTRDPSYLLWIAEKMPHRSAAFRWVQVNMDLLNIILGIDADGNVKTD
jgi:hypothetical protein